MKVDVKMKIPNRIKLGVLKISLLFALAAIAVACTAGQELIPLVVSVGGRNMSKLPYLIAADQGLYEKHGLDVEFLTGDPEFEGGIKTYLGFWTSVGVFLGLQEEPVPDIMATSHMGRMLRQVGDPQSQKLVAMGATDCSVRYYVIARPGIHSLEELKGKRLGINSEVSTLGFSGRRMLQRMGWERDRDISVVIPGRMEHLRNGEVDAIITGDNGSEAAAKEGFTILEDMGAWNEELAGNSAIVEAEWLQDATHREAARRFLMATAEAVALFHQRPDLALDVLVKWEGMDRELAESRYRRTDYIPRKPYPCIEGVEKTMELYDSEEMRRYQPEDFYDDSLMRELDESGFLDGLYD